MFSLPRVGVFIEASAIELSKSMGVLGKMAGYPVEDHGDALQMAPVHEVAEFIRVTVTAGWRIVTGDLVAPGAIERMLGHRHQLDMGKAGVLDIRNQTVP